MDKNKQQPQPQKSNNPGQKAPGQAPAKQSPQSPKQSPSNKKGF